MTGAGIAAGTDLSDLAFWRRPVAERDAAFRRLRALAHPAGYREMPRPGGTENTFYALVRHSDVVEASRHPEVFSSAGEGATPRMRGFAEYFGSMINMDDPRHARLRTVVSRAFTPKLVARLRSYISTTAERLVAELAAAGPCDFVAHVAAPMPLEVICELVGVPERHRPFVLERSNTALSGVDPDYVPDPGQAAGVLLGAVRDLHALAQDLAAHRRRQPGDDLISLLTGPGRDGDRLTAAEIGSFFILLLVAGNETTRHAISGGLVLLTNNPGQRVLLQRDFDQYGATAVEEVVRCASPVNYMARQLTRDHKLRGRTLRAGERVRLYYRSANRDEAVFFRPDEFDVARRPNPHVAFGGPGPHFCLGAHLARTEMTALFGKLLRTLPEVHATGTPERLVSSFINGIKRLPCAPR